MGSGHLIASIRSNWFIYLILIAITLVVYSDVTRFGFAQYDDNIYIVKNPHIKDGLTPSGIAWALPGGSGAGERAVQSWSV